VQACRAAKVCVKTVYNWRHADPGDASFLEAFKQAKILAGETLEAEAIRRAHDGVDEPVYQGGRLVGWKRVYSDTLLIFLLKGLMPEKYRERWEGEVKVPTPVTVIIKEEA
jgi:hypothetical protein